jgi:hypothetical protein
MERPTDEKIDLVTMLRPTGEILAGLTSEKRANYKQVSLFTPPKENISS